MSLFKKTLRAGPLTVEAVYPAPHPRDSESVRRGKKRLTSAAQARLNKKNAWRKLELEIAANFAQGDLFLTLTYDDQHLPKDRKNALREIGRFVRKLRQARKQAGKELRYIYCTEHRHGEGRWHHHILLNAAGEDYSLLQKLWGNGEAEAKKIAIDRDQTYEALAHYLCKEPPEKVGHRMWSCSRNLKKPEKTCDRVPDDTQIQPPRGAAILEVETIRTQYGTFQYYKYLEPGWECWKAERPGRRRRRQRRC